MPYSIIYEPLNRIAGVKPKTFTRNTAVEAWAEVQMLNASDEKTEIKDESGNVISWQELRARALKEVS